MFSSVSEITNLKSKKFFIEKIQLYIKIVDQTLLANNLIPPKEKTEVTSLINKRLIELNIISKSDDITQLSKVLKAQLFNDFITALKASSDHKKIISNSLDKLDPKKRRKLQLSEAKKNKPKIVDFFCGAGGLSLGFIREGFSIDLANDYEDVCIETYRYNHPEISSERVILGDIRDLVNDINSYIKDDIDVVVGGPPCQGFSSANQQRIIDDPRNELYKYFIRAVTAIAPKFVIMENVRGMLPYAEQISGDYSDIIVENNGKKHTYKTSFRVLVSNNFGVAQKRQRLIFIAVRSDISIEKDVTPEQIFLDIEHYCQNQKHHVLNDALEFIKSLDAPRIKNMTDVDDETTGKKVDFNKYSGNENSYLKLINNGKRVPLVFNHKARYTNDINYEIYKTLDEGDDGTNEKIKDLMPYKNRNHIFKDKYFRLVGNKPSRTITAHLKMDCHSHIHPRQTRSITPREAARIQSFPDNYVFLGAYLKTYMQIGNAVPPVMAKGIAKVLKKYV